MTRLRIATLIVTLLVAAPPRVGGDTYPRQPGIDVLHYLFRLTLDDQTGAIDGEATVTVRIVRDDVREIALDLSSVAAERGMTVLGVSCDRRPVEYRHSGNRLLLTPASVASAGTDLSFTVRYRGVPAAGLRPLDNVYGERTIFSDNWPDRARQWLPTVDHPYDKATAEFVVTAPSQYQVVANGVLVEEVDLAGGRRQTHWRQDTPIASWLFAVGVARFATHHYDVVRGIPLQVWVFPQDRAKGQAIFELTGRRAFEYFSDWIGPYSYDKLAHVEASGVSGGMEHATAIFYGERNVIKGDAPVVHEVAHQWWGNAVTEKDWDDVWLSEGFATYFTHLYTEHYSGRDAFVRRLKADVAVIADAQRTAPEQAVIHRNLSDMTRVLNRFVYQKGGWVLHMLRGLVGTERFWEGIREYYRRYRDGNASTDDFRQVMERSSGQDLTWFFDQWLKRPGLVKLAGVWRYDAVAKQVSIELSQTQPGPPYRLPLDIGVTSVAGARRITRVELTGAAGRFTVPADSEPQSVELDPDTWVLMEPPELVKDRPAVVLPGANKGLQPEAR
jgi:aminopeptidase N